MASIHQGKLPCCLGALLFRSLARTVGSWYWRHISCVWQFSHCKVVAFRLRNGKCSYWEMQVDVPVGQKDSGNKKQRKVRNQGLKETQKRNTELIASNSKVELKLFH